MKVCKVIHINDGDAKELTNGNFLFAEEYTKMSDILNEYLADGWEVKSMAPEFMHGRHDSGPLFYCCGFTFYLEREV